MRLILLASVFSLLLTFSRADQAGPVRKGKYLLFQGTGQPDPSVTNKTQRQALAQQSAIVEAQKQLALYIDNLKTRKKTFLKDEKLKDRKLELKINSFLTNFQIGKAKCDDEDNCTVMLKVNRKKLLKDLQAQE